MPIPALPEHAEHASAPAGGALRAGLQRARHRAPRSVLFMVALCLGIAVLLWAFAGGSFVIKTVYSFSIGFVCWGVMEGARLLQALAVDSWRRWRGQPLHAAGFASGWRGVFPAMLATVIAGPSIGLALADALTGQRSASLLQFGAAETRMTIALTLLGSLAAVFALSTMERLASARALAEAAQRAAAESRLKLLEAQLEPHMLFNTLANLRALIAVDPVRAQAMLDRLIAFLRATLSASRSDAHSLAAEFERIGDYLALMGVRMGARLQSRLDLPAALRDAAVPPLLLQPLVENSIRHGLEPKIAGGRIDVQALRDGAQLVLNVRDDGVGLAPGAAEPHDGRFGLQQVRDRLHTLYAGRAGLELQALPAGGTLATIRLPIER
jgi:signal transduction histidine kinase